MTSQRFETIAREPWAEAPPKDELDAPVTKVRLEPKYKNRGRGGASQQKRKDVCPSKENANGKKTHKLQLTDGVSGLGK